VAGFSFRHLDRHNVKYSKPPLTFEQQADLLLARGLVADKAEVVAKLGAVNYYRLSAYWRLFRRPDDTFEPGTKFETIWRRYTFDRQFRLLVMDGIERVEIAVRSRLIYELVHKHGAFAHLDIRAFPGIPPAEHQRLLDELHDNAQRSREAFVEHFRTTYDEFPELPLWTAIETMMFGQMLTMFRHSGKHLQQAVAADYEISGTVLQSWLFTLNYIRNLCAHHARLWNRELAIKPIIPDLRHDPRWHSPHPVPNNRMFAVLTLLRYMLSHCAIQSKWRDRLFALFDGYSEIPLASMGIPPDWRSHPLWL
jgi:abortive infection bacteriophage resistance protein